MRVAIVLAGGSGTRVGAGVNKVFVELAGRPALAWSTAAMAEVADALVVVARHEDLDDARALLGATGLAAVVVRGGATRHASEEAGLAAAVELGAVGDDDVIAIHDGARPLLSTDLASRVFDEAARVGGAWPALDADDLCERVGGRVGPRRPGLLRAQTPQAFRAAGLHRAYAAAAADDFAGTDTLETVLRYGEVECVAVEADPRNIKVTYAEDFAAAERLLAAAEGRSRGPGR